MGMVATCQRLVSSFCVFFGRHGDVSHYARERGVSRQTVYRESTATVAAIEGSALRAQVADLEQENQQLHAHVQELQACLAVAEARQPLTVTIDADKQAEFASVGEASGVSLPIARRLLEVFLRNATPSVAQLGRYTRAAGLRASALLPVLDEHSRPLTRHAAADELFAGRQPILMVVAQDSLCWLSGRLAPSRDGEQWAQEFRTLPNLELVTKDGGTGMIKGLEIVRAERQACVQPAPAVQTLNHGSATPAPDSASGQPAPVPALPAIAEQDDHFHVIREGLHALRRQQGAVTRALEKADQAQKALDRQARQGKSRAGTTTAVNRLWHEAEQLLDQWAASEVVWKKIHKALGLFTTTGELNTRAQAEAVIAENLPLLPGPAWAKVRRLLQRPTLFTYLDQVHEHLAALPVDPEVRKVIVRREGLRRRPELVQGEGERSAALRGVLLLTGVLVHLLGAAGESAADAVCAVLRQAWRASSVVEGLNSVLRMHQSRHRRLSQELLDLKRLYWNCHTFRTGRRQDQTPYGRLGLILPKKRWWELLKLTPEQLRQQLSAQGVVT
jgi:hypothetical protein